MNGPRTKRAEAWAYVHLALFGSSDEAEATEEPGNER
jgi:hypothetical protein